VEYSCELIGSSVPVQHPPVPQDSDPADRAMAPYRSFTTSRISFRFVVIMAA